MIQATNELVLGIELNEQYAQITYYHQSVREPMTLGASADAEHTLLPMGMCQDSRGEWQLWDPQKKDGTDQMHGIDGLYEKLMRQEDILYHGRNYRPGEILAAYFRLCLARLKLLTQGTRLYIMVTVHELDEPWSNVIVEALELNGLDRRQIFLQDYLSSFFYHTINQKKELWYQDVALLTYEEEAIIGYVLHIDRSTRPAIATVDRVARQPVGEDVRAGRSEAEWKKEKDRLFFELLKKVFERRTISASYLMGDYFNKSWAERSIQFLCYRRHAFQGMNLYSRGACYAVMERIGLIEDHGVIFGGHDMIERNLGMEMRIRGKETYYPLVNAGINWYEAHHVCEFILDGEREIRIISQPMAEGESIVHMMRLPGLPSRPNRGTRVRMTVYFSSASCCHIEVEDLGFGGLYRSSGLKWQRALYI